MSSSRAIRLYEGFHRRKPKRGEVVQLGLPRAVEAIEVGELYGVMYRLKGKPKPFVHKFRRRSIRLLVSSDGRQLFALGNVKFTARGFTG